MSETLASPAAPARRARRRDMRPLALAIVAGAIAVLGYVVTLLPGQQYSPSETREARRSAAFEGLEGAADRPLVADNPESASPDTEARRRLDEARSLLAAGDYDRALQRLNEARGEIRHLPESYLLVGLALLGKQDYSTARDFFNAAIDRDRGLAEAYFGFAVAAEGLGDLEQALGGMRSFLHLQADPDPYRHKVAQARSAIWEWETQLGRGAWGPTKGIPPGFTEAELRRDARGAGTKVPIPGTENEQGYRRYTIKHSDRIEMYER